MHSLDSISQALVRFLFLSAIGVAHTACSDSGQVPATKPGEIEPPEPCGELDPTTAATITVDKLEKAMRATFAALGPIDTSTVLARALSLGHEKTLTPSADGLKWLDEDELPMLREKALVAENVESVEGSQVVFLLRPDVVCKTDPPDGGLDPNAERVEQECRERYTKTPSRIAVSRVACGTEDNVHVALLTGADRKEYLNLDLIQSRVVARLDLGALASAATIKREQDAQAEPLFEEGATGRIELVEDVVAANRVHLTVRVTNPVALESSEPHDGGTTSRVAVNVSANTDPVIDCTADGTAQKLECTVALGPVRVTLPFEDFIPIFNRQAAPGVSAAESVEFNVPSVAGQLSYDANGDTLRATGLSIGDGPTRVLHGGDTVLSWEVNPAAEHHVDIVGTGQEDGSVAVTIPGGFDLRLHYAMAPVKDLVADPWRFSLDDDVALTLAGGTSPSALLLAGPTDGLNLVEDADTSLFRVQSGTFEGTSRFAPNEAVSVQAGSCLNRRMTNGDHELLQNLSSGACETVPKN